MALPTGPSFTPTVINNQADLQNIFGVPDGTHYGPYTAQQYLQSQGTVTIVRVGGLGGYTQKNPLLVVATKGTTSRFYETSDFISYCFSGSVSSSFSASVTSSYIYGIVAAQFTDGIYSGSAYSLGYVSGSLSGTQISASTFVSASISLPVISGSSQFSGSLISGKVYTLSNGAIQFSASLAGNYGPFNPSTFTSASYSSSANLVLAVLANTAYDTAQNLWGFDGSTLTPSTTSSLTLAYTLNLKEVAFSSASTGQSASYGSYPFSLDRTSPYYIKNVFGTDPKAGQGTLTTGYLPKAAYVYKAFDYSIDTVAGQLLQNGSWQINVVTSDGLVLNTPAVNCTPASLVSQSVYVTSYAMQFQDGIPGGGNSTNLNGSAFDITNAYTPWVISQNLSPISGFDQRYELFRFHTLSDGTPMNKKYKIEISNVKLAGSILDSNYGSFTVSVRDYNDTDQSPVYLESYQNVTLDPTSTNYIARVIGDTYSFINFSGKELDFGTYNNVSKLIRVEMASDVYPVQAVPYGFEAYATPIGGTLANNVPPMQYSIASTYALNPGKYASGVAFQNPPPGADSTLTALYPTTNAYLDNVHFFAPLPNNTTTGNNTKFSLDAAAGISAVYSLSTEATLVPQRVFQFGFQGGFDGISPSIPIYTGDQITPTNQQGLDCSTINSSGSVGYAQALAAIGNAEAYDINLLVTPGINYNYHSYVVTTAVNTCQNRGDAFYILDLYQDQSAGGNAITNVVNAAAQFDTSYAAAYYPWVKITDPNTNKIITVPPSVVLPAVYAQSDASSAEWYAPAGLNRGGIPNAIGVNDRLTQSDRDKLYAGKVNPIAQFPGQGVVVWGQKTLQNKASALDRVNVRRLMINLKKVVASTSKYLLFEGNTNQTRNQFLSIVNPYMERVQQNQGLYAFKVVCDSSNNDNSTIDRNQLVGNIYIQPTKTAEFIVVPFSILPTGATFPS